MDRARELFERLETEGYSGVQKLIQDRKAEELFLDFKRAHRNGDNPSMSDQVRNTLSEAIAGFANTEGGIIIWGVDCSKCKDGSDLPKVGEQPEIVQVKRFVSWLNDAVSGATLPPHSGVQNIPLPKEGSEDGFVVTYVSKGLLVPYRQLQGKETHGRYPIRAGSSFVATSHDTLAGLFGRRPQPKLALKLGIAPVGDGQSTDAKFDISFILTNIGSVIARDVYFNAYIFSKPGPNCSIGCCAPDESFSKFRTAFGIGFSTVSNAGERFAPGSIAIPAKLEFRLQPPFNQEFKLEIGWGCEGSPASKWTLETSLEDWQLNFDELKTLEARPTGYLDSGWHAAIVKLLNIPAPYEI